MGVISMTGISNQIKTQGIVLEEQDLKAQLGNMLEKQWEKFGINYIEHTIIKHALIGMQKYFLKKGQQTLNITFYQQVIKRLKI